jgi:hypothetical protein
VWNVEYTDEFEDWWNSLNEEEQNEVAKVVTLLEEYGPHLPFPFSSAIHGSKYGHMRELRIQHKGDPYRSIYAFDPKRKALLLLGGKKTGDDRWYDENVPLADKIYDKHLKELEREERWDK